MTRLLPLAVVAAVVAVASAGCGGTSSTTTTNETQVWANTVCGSLTIWKNSLQQVATSLANPATISKDTLTTAVADVNSANDRLRQSLTQLERPDTVSGGQAKDTLDTLRGQLSSEWASIQDSLATSAQPLDVVASASATLVTMRDQIKQAFADLEKLDVNGELEQAVQTSPACEPYLGK